MELWFQNGTSISKSNFDFKMELRFRNWSSISKSKLHFKIEAPFRNGSSIFRWKLHLKIEVRIWNLSSISKWKPQKCSVYLSYISVMSQMEHRNIHIKNYLLKQFRSSYRRCSIRKGVLRNFAKFKGKYLCQSLFFKKVAGLRPELSLCHIIKIFTCDKCVFFQSECGKIWTRKTPSTDTFQAVLLLMKKINWRVCVTIVV